MARDCGPFIDRQVVLLTLVSRAEKISEGLKSKDIEDYQTLMNRFHDSNGRITGDPEFQRRFRAYYRLNSAGLTPGFMTGYFKLMETRPRYTEVDLAGICKTLKAQKDRQGRENLQFSFCTKLAATLNPDYPIYDACVSGVFHFTPPRPPLPYEERVRRYLSFYDDCLRPTVQWLASSPQLADLIKAQARRFPQWDALSSTKQIDFLFWAAGKPEVKEKASQRSIRRE